MRRLLLAAAAAALLLSGFSAAPATATATAAAAAPTQPVITLAVSPGQPHAGGSYLVSGTIKAPNGTGGYVGMAARLTLTGPGYSSAFSVSTSGTFHHAVTRALPTTWTARFAGDAAHLSATGSTSFTTVPNPTRIVGYDAGPEPAYRGGAIDFHGYLQRLSPTTGRWTGYGGQRVVITRSSPAGYVTARTTTATGYFAGLIHGRNILVTASWVPSYAGWSVGSTVVNSPVVGPGDRVDTKTPPIRIARVQYDPPGVDANNINGEHVMLLNFGTTTANLNGWSLRPPSGAHVFTFSTDVYLRPGQNVTVYTGKGVHTAVHFFFGLQTSIWSNTGGTADLFNDLGVLADSCSWGNGIGFTSC